MTPISRLFLLLALSLAVASCSSPEPAPPAGPTPEQALNRYATALVTEYQAELSGHEPAVLTMDSPLSYVLVFETRNPAMLTKELANNDESGYQRNLEVTERWQAIYCTGDLKAIMREHSIFSAGAHIADSSGKRHSLAVCTE